MDPIPCSSAPEADPRAQSAERRALVVALLTLATMGAEVGFGLATGSMALLADGVHMGTHALALGITVIAYVAARRWHRHPGFSFGTGKLGVLGAYTNALLLGVTALALAAEAVGRLVSPHAIDFDTALWVAVLGLAVNLVSALVLGHHHDHDHHDHDHDHDHDHEDVNLRAAWAHVVTDALTSVLAIAALVAGRWVGWVWLDPAAGLLGAGLILSWAWGLLRDSGAVLVDFGDFGDEAQTLRQRLEAGGDRVTDLHIWRCGENRRSLVVEVEAQDPATSGASVRSSLGPLAEAFDHVTVEVRHGRG